MTKLDLIGQRFGRLTVLSEVRKKVRNRSAVYWKCRCDCGGEKITIGDSLRRGLTTSCGCYRKEVTSKLQHNRLGKDAPNWHGGRKMDKDGYIQVLVGKRKYRPEHCVVMEQHLGRPLFPGETVHHKNGIRHENNIGNLELKASNHGPGQTIPDLLAWAKEILQRYEVLECVHS